MNDNKTIRRTLRSVLLMMTALMTAACNGESAPEGKPSQPGSAIAFTIDDGTTRASHRTAPNTLTLNGSGTNEQSLKTEGFGVFACYTGYYRYVSSTITSNLMWNQQVTYDNTLSRWAYSPLVYWPATELLDDEAYATFYAYAPYSDATDPYGSIVDFSHPSETGDPWLTYQLGGTMYADGANGWKAKQADLLYDIQKDQQRPYPPTASKVTFQFKHALACVGDEITVTCSDNVQTQLKGLYSSADVTLTLNTLRLDYTLTAKGRLVLNGSDTPNWKVLDSGDATVHRLLVLNPDQVIATATSASVCTLTPYTATNQGLFYIPLEVAGNPQTLTATADYTLSTGTTGQIATTISLSSIRQAGEGRNLNLVLDFSNP